MGVQANLVEDLKIGKNKLRRVCVNDVDLYLSMAILDRVSHEESELVLTSSDSLSLEGGVVALRLRENETCLPLFLGLDLRADFLSSSDQVCTLAAELSSVLNCPEGVRDAA